MKVRIGALCVVCLWLLLGGLACAQDWGAYAPLLRQWQRALKADDMEDDLVNPACLYLYRNASRSVGCTLRDLNEDGTPELIIGEMASVNIMPGFIMDVYTLQGDTPVSVLRGWERNAYYLTAGGMILNEGASSAFDSELVVYRVQGAQLVFQGSIRYLGGDEKVSGGPWHYLRTADERPSRDNALKEKEARKAQKALMDSVVRLELTSFADLAL